MKFIGRRWTIVVAFIVSGGALLIAAIVNATAAANSDLLYWLNLVSHHCY